MGHDGIKVRKHLVASYTSVNPAINSVKFKN